MSSLSLAMYLAAASPAAPPPCYDAEVIGGSQVLVYRGDRACIEFGPQREFTGVWKNWFEGSGFLDDRPDPATDRDTWFSYDERTEFPRGFKPRSGHAYRLRFVGHRASTVKPEPLEGYGHMGGSRSLVLADRVFEIVDLGPMPRPL